MTDQEIIKYIKSMSRIDVPGDFTQRVMARVLEKNDSFLKRILRVLLRHRGEWNRFGGIVTSPRTREECAVSYGLSGVYYLVLGIVLLVGLKALSAEMIVGYKSNSIHMLSWFSLSAAAWLLGLALVMFFGGQRALAGAKAGTLLFVAAVLASMLVFVQYLWFPVMFVSIAVFLSAVFMGVLLYYQISIFKDYNDKRNDRTVNA